MPRFTLQPSEFSAGVLITSLLLSVAGIFKDCKGCLAGRAAVRGSCRIHHEVCV